MASRFLFCLLLACAVLPAAARQPAMMDANGASAGCDATAEADAEDDAVRPTDKRAALPARARATTPRRGESGSTARPPRWHSFLPGMIR